MARQYKYAMGISVNGPHLQSAVALPDPSEWNYQVGDLDTEGGRDATGLLHRAYVATKINYEFSWNALEWEMLQVILAAVLAPKFSMTAPDPRTFNTSYTGDYYVGDRTGKCYYFFDSSADSTVPDGSHEEKAQFNLKLKFIEY